MHDRRPDSLGTSALVTAVLGLMMSCCCGVMASPLSLVALVLGVVSLWRVSVNPFRYQGRGTAIIAIVIALVALGVQIGLFALGVSIQVLDALSRM